MSNFKDVRRFHDKFQMGYAGPPRPLPMQMSMFRLRFILEELEEYTDAVLQSDLPGQLDALVDLVYIIMGTAVCHGFDFDAAWKRVHVANMKKKLGVADGRPFALSKVMKADGWKPPVHEL